VIDQPVVVVVVVVVEFPLSWHHPTLAGQTCADAAAFPLPLLPQAQMEFGIKNLISWPLANDLSKIGRGTTKLSAPTNCPRHLPTSRNKKEKLSALQMYCQSNFMISPESEEKLPANRLATPPAIIFYSTCRTQARNELQENHSRHGRVLVVVLLSPAYPIVCAV